MWGESFWIPNLLVKFSNGLGWVLHHGVPKCFQRMLNIAKLRQTSAQLPRTCTQFSV